MTDPNDSYLGLDTNVSDFPQKPQSGGVIKQNKEKEKKKLNTDIQVVSRNAVTYCKLILNKIAICIITLY